MDRRAGLPVVGGGRASLDLRVMDAAALNFPVSSFDGLVVYYRPALHSKALLASALRRVRQSAPPRWLASCRDEDRRRGGLAP
jgi:hypothetical protein